MFLSFDVVVEGNKIKLQEADSTAACQEGGDMLQFIQVMQQATGTVKWVTERRNKSPGEV